MLIASLFTTNASTATAEPIDIINLESGTKVTVGTTAYTIQAKLGKGGFGVVYRAIRTDTGERIALRISLSSNMQFQSDLTLSELDRFVASPAFRNSEHLLDYSQPQTAVIEKISTVDRSAPAETISVVIQTTKELTPLTSISDQLKIDADTTPAETAKRVRAIKLIYEQATAGLLVLAKEGYSHRDIKPANMGINGSLEDLLDGKAKLVIFDYDLLQKNYYQTHAEGVQGTLGYIAPELFAHDGKNGQSLSTTMADFYALGNSVFELLAGALPSADAGNPETSSAGRFFRMIKSSTSDAGWYEWMRRPIVSYFDRMRANLSRGNAVIAIDVLQDLRAVEGFVTAATARSHELRIEALETNQFLYTQADRTQLASVLSMSLTNAISALCDGLSSKYRSSGDTATVTMDIPAAVGNR